MLPLPGHVNYKMLTAGVVRMLHWFPRQAHENRLTIVHTLVTGWKWGRGPLQRKLMESRIVISDRIPTITKEKGIAKMKSRWCAVSNDQPNQAVFNNSTINQWKRRDLPTWLQRIWWRPGQAEPPARTNQSTSPQTQRGSPELWSPRHPADLQSEEEYNRILFTKWHTQPKLLETNCGRLRRPGNTWAGKQAKWKHKISAQLLLQIFLDFSLRESFFSKNDKS